MIAAIVPAIIAIKLGSSSPVSSPEQTEEIKNNLFIFNRNLF